MTQTFSRRSGLLFGAAAALIAIGIGFAASFYMGAASFAYFLMLLGILSRRGNRARHRTLMAAAMGIDLLLVLALEIQRNAVETVFAFDLTPLQLSHVLASSLAVALYFPLVLLGTKLWAAESPATRAWHRRLGMTAFALRSIGFVLMFSLLGRYT